MPIEFETGFGVNSLIWVTSLDSDEMGPTRRIVEDLYDFFRPLGLTFLVYDVPSAADLYEKLDGIAGRAQLGAKPFIHLDMHGTEDGLAIAATNELAPWSSVMPKFQAINVATRCNLAVVAGVCYALNAIKEVKINAPCPVHMLIAPEEFVYVDFLEDNTVKFYQAVFSSGRIDKAYEDHLSDQLKVFYSEKLLGIALARYIRDSCKGKGSRERKEFLLTEVLSGGQPPSKENLKRIRQQIKENIIPDQSLSTGMLSHISPADHVHLRLMICSPSWNEQMKREFSRRSSRCCIDVLARRLRRSGSTRCAHRAPQIPQAGCRVSALR